MIVPMTLELHSTVFMFDGGGEIDGFSEADGLAFVLQRRASFRIVFASGEVPTRGRAPALIRSSEAQLRPER